MDEKYTLLVEDNPDDVTLTEMAFRRAKIPSELVVVGDGKEALDFLFCRGNFAHKVPDNKPSVILLDLKLPLISGLEVLKEIRTHNSTRQIPIVVLTSSVEQEDTAESYELGADDFIRKPIGFSQFIEIIRQIGAKWLGTDGSSYDI